ncbi:MAG TPA: AAA family ATPase, partial [Candidatus Obscuribacterales bacterium]
MSNPGVKPFENNWAYLKTELRWLDRVLMMAVSRKRQDDKILHRVTNTAADKVTSHWWKGIIAVNRGIDDREGPPPKAVPQPGLIVSYSQQLEVRLQASQQAGIILALPLLRDRLQLSEIEKNIILMALAPEINRRYGRLYDYLQEEEGALADLPTVDLCLRLLCRNDHDWQQARARLAGPQSLVSRSLVEWIGDEDGTLLSQQVRVGDELANFLLADHPTATALEAILTEVQGTALSASADPTIAVDPLEELAIAPAAPPLTAEQSPPPLTQQVTISWEQLVLPQKLLQQLQYVGRQAQQRPAPPDLMGLMVLLVGAAGTGKTLAATALAAQLGCPLTCVELAALTPDHYPQILTDSPSENTSLLLL